MLEEYEETPISIPVDIAKDVVKNFARTLSGSLGPGGMDLEAIQEWLLKFWEDRKKFFTSVKRFLAGYTIGSRPGQSILHLCLDT